MTEWKDMEFAEPQVGPHSNWQDEAKAWKAKAKELAKENAILRTEKHADAECIGHLERRVQELETALSETAEELFVAASECYELTNHMSGAKDLYYQRRQVFRKARAALKQEGE